jgi:hypothetical protein
MQSNKNQAELTIETVEYNFQEIGVEEKLPVDVYVEFFYPYNIFHVVFL